MREILFRGKRVDNGEWVYSSFLMQDKEHKLLSAEVELFDGEKWRAVIPETVGEYTGLTDKNGKRIFEGDILSDGDDTYKVVFDEGVFRIENSNYTTGVYVAIHMDKINEVVGNIYDNPELLEDWQ